MSLAGVPAPLLVALGLLGLLVGAEMLVRGGSRVAARLGVSPLVIGLTVVSVGTSLPELAVGVDAALRDSGELAVGNIVGTNTVNLLLVLGLSALLVPIAIEGRVLRQDLPAVLVASALLLVLALDGDLGTPDGVVLLGAGVLYLGLVLRSARGRDDDTGDDIDDDTGDPVLDAAPGAAPEAGGRLWRDLGTLLAGIVVLVVGAELLVDGAVDVAASFGISEAVIGLTVIAIGTSAPELVTTVVGTVRGERDIALGNLLGSSVLNIAVVLGLTVLVAPGAVPVPGEVIAVDLLLMVAVAVLCVPVFVTGRRISRVEGGLFVATYGAYLAYLLVWRVG